MSQKIYVPGENEVLIEPLEQHAILLPTNTPTEEDPRLMSERAICRWKTGIQKAREIRKENGDGTVIVVAFGGWALHNRLPLVLHHAFAAWKLHIYEPHELNLATAHGFATVGDIGKTLTFMDQSVGRGYIGHFCSSKGHTTRAITEAGMHQYFSKLYHLESGEIRQSETEDIDWCNRAVKFPPYQHALGCRSADIARNGAAEARKWAERMRVWAEANPQLWKEYMQEMASFIMLLEENNVMVRCDGDGCMKICLNSFSKL